ncbi:MarR family transcriptional regulator [Gordonia sp. TBRC 11910]|uniref:MarR family transcriptional regulator n=1 Tax=Gordonia asplenii TaxID=2725283 RepID=A0A848L7N7_9ACTN|nr:MarR family transcriptional regulator [Gordonia asplenii]NMO03588.1 MarR family transcriptional regulator [Gordonia asplenii]
MADIDDATVDELFGVLTRYVRMRERASQVTMRTDDGVIETAAYKCLFQLAERPMRSSKLAELMSADPSTISRHVAALVKLGYVRREADPDDGRATLLVATDDGLARADVIRSHRRERLHRLLDGWSAGELSTLVGLLTRFVDAAEDVLVPAACAQPGGAKPDDENPQNTLRESSEKGSAT